MLSPLLALIIVVLAAAVIVTNPIFPQIAVGYDFAVGTAIVDGMIGVSQKALNANHQNTTYPSSCKKLAQAGRNIAMFSLQKAATTGAEPLRSATPVAMVQNENVSISH